MSRHLACDRRLIAAVRTALCGLLMTPLAAAGVDPAATPPVPDDPHAAHGAQHAAHTASGREDAGHGGAHHDDSAARLGRLSFPT